ncbi:MAG: hypothetical protein GY749_35125, partial [Desulfobacteraceae bacterium]|nr:hypothetical protein [Desulfobacteraceae bacterium]
MPKRKKRTEENNELRKRKKEKKKAEKKLRESQKAQGLNPPVRESLPNHKCPYETVEEERSEREEAVTEQMRIMKGCLPVLLKRLAGIDDPRNPKKCKHKLTVLMIYGILTFVFQMSSRREANREMTRPMFVQKRAHRRPGDTEKQSSMYSGKKKMHTVKNTVISTADKVILFVGQTFAGHNHDYKILKEELCPDKPWF